MKYTVEDLLRIMKTLRGPNGCPWDRKQTLESLRPYLVEECYEVLEAVEKGDHEEHKKELGDLLLQIVFHAEIAEEEGWFTFEDVVDSIARKLVERHPHVFGEDKVENAEEVLERWERRKVEKENAHPFQGIPQHLPALLKAWRISEKAAQFGFDWEDAHGVWEKFSEELKEFEEAWQAGNQQAMEHELGDLLFCLANVARHLSFNPEDALQRINRRFQRRFLWMFEKIKKEGKRMEEYSMEELDALWEESKKEEVI